MNNNEHKGPVNNRRRFMRRAGQLAAGTLIATSAGGAIAGQGKHGGAFSLSADAENICATCQYWGAKRRVTQDGARVTIGSLGWCNNRKSPRFGRMTSPETGPMKAWVKWSALGDQ